MHYWTVEQTSTSHTNSTPRGASNLGLHTGTVRTGNSYGILTRNIRLPQPIPPVYQTRRPRRVWRRGNAQPCYSTNQVALWLHGVSKANKFVLACRPVSGFPAT
jgi:hypothetical protein